MVNISKDEKDIFFLPSTINIFVYSIIRQHLLQEFKHYWLNTFLYIIFIIKSKQIYSSIFLLAT